MAVFMYKSHRNSLPAIFKNYFITNTSIHGHHTRSCQNLHLIQSRTNIRFFSIRMAGPRLWNTIDITTRELNTVHSYKRTIKQKLLNGQTFDEYYYNVWNPPKNLFATATCHYTTPPSIIVSFIWGGPDKPTLWLLPLQSLDI